jgi:teichoic acid transport system ATP-binding protein
MTPPDIAIKVENLGKRYEIYDKPQDRLKQSLWRGRKQFFRDFWALKDVSFEVKKGETFGIIGRNGSGKSTLLQMICGTLTPTTGQVTVNGRVAALLELGSGFNPEFTGRENIYMNAAILGLSRAEIDARFNDIVAFADIGQFIEQPVKTYSSGMHVRLAFAVAINVDPDILIVDEALSVGDALFQSKCYAKFRQFQERGVSILFVTHSLDMVTAHCNRAMLIHKGQLLAQGSPIDVVEKYRKLLNVPTEIVLDSSPKDNNHRTVGAPIHPAEKEWDGLFQLNPNVFKYGIGHAEILEAGIFTTTGEPTQILERNCDYDIKVKILHHEVMPAATVAFVIKDLRGTPLCGTNTFYENMKMGPVEAGEVILVSFRQLVPLNPGNYLLSVGCHCYADEGLVDYDVRADCMVFQVTAKGFRHGIYDSRSQIEWVRCGKMPAEMKRA